MIRNPGWESDRLKNLLTQPWTSKIFHHALFDLRFLYANTGLEVQGDIECTKTLRKIAYPQLSSGLRSALKDAIDLDISKAEQQSDWGQPTLTESQIEYAINDVLFLSVLQKKLMNELKGYQVEVYRRAVETIKNKAFLEIEGYTVLLDHLQEEAETTLKNRNWWTERTVRCGANL